MTGNLAQAAAKSANKETTTATFRADVLTESARQPVLVEFWGAASAAASRQLSPMLEKAVLAAAGKVKLARMNAEAHPQIAAQLGVQSLPAVIAFQRGQPVDGFMGVLPETQIRGFIERLAGPLASESADLLAEADALAASGDVAAAAEIYTDVLETDPGNAAALAGLAKAYLHSGDLATAKALLGQAPTDARKHPAFVAAQAALDIAEQAASVGDVAGLQRRVAQEPKNHQARFDLALALNAKGNREEAAAALLEIIKADRKWEEDGARKQLVQFFEAWGPMDADTLVARRKLTGLLFS